MLAGPRPPDAGTPCTRPARRHSGTAACYAGSAGASSFVALHPKNGVQEITAQAAVLLPVWQPHRSAAPRSCLVLKRRRVAGGQNLALAAALRLHMSDRQPQIETATKARQGETTGVVRWVPALLDPRPRCNGSRLSSVLKKHLRSHRKLRCQSRWSWSTGSSVKQGDRHRAAVAAFVAACVTPDPWRRPVPAQRLTASRAAPCSSPSPPSRSACRRSSSSGSAA